MATLPGSVIPAPLRDHPWAAPVEEILTACLEAVDPYRAIQKTLRRRGDTLTLNSHSLSLSDVQNVYLIGVGKACLGMAEAAVEQLGPHLSGGILIPKAQPELSIPDFPSSLEIYPAGHPVPDERGVEAAQAVIDLLQTTTEQDLVIVLISGGGSALLTAPVNGVSLSDLQDLNRALLASGANIQEINTLRKHLSRLKGGKLAREAAPARVWTLILSDVIGNSLDSIASGPTVPDPTTYPMALKVLDGYRLRKHIPEAILTHLSEGARGKIPETPKPGEDCFQDTEQIIIADNSTALQAGAEKARKLGFATQIISAQLEGEARKAGKDLAQRLKESISPAAQAGRPLCLLAGGETTVTLGENPVGKGGRNLELALSAVEPLAGLEDIALITLATDGEDGPTDAAGAIVTGDTQVHAETVSLSPSAYLLRHDSYSFFQTLERLILTGPTGTNVNDLVFMFAF
jgi:hydroxypyruvate reductase